MKRYVADTHALLWALAKQHRRLGRAARRVMTSLDGGDVEVVVSVVSLWEVALLHDEGKLRLGQGFSAWCDALEAAPGLHVEPLLRADVEQARALRTLRDPHDRLIAGTAARLSVPLLTADSRISSSGVRVVWD